MSKFLEGGAVVSVLSGRFSGTQSGVNIRCPNCGSHYSHVRRAGTLLGSDTGEARVYPGTEQVGTTGSRRSAVEIIFDCEECPQLFALVIRQCKGVNEIEVHADVEAPAQPRVAGAY